MIALLDPAHAGRVVGWMVFVAPLMVTVVALSIAIVGFAIALFLGRGRSDCPDDQRTSDRPGHFIIIAVMLVAVTCRRWSSYS